jgi:hypothetical protein
MVLFRVRRCIRVRVALAILFVLALLAGAGCGGGGEEGEHRPELTERDAAGDVVDVRAVKRVDDEAWDEKAVASMMTDGQPGLDLRGAGLEMSGRKLRLDVETEGPIRAGTFMLAASTKVSCGTAQLTAYIHVRDDGGTAVEATDRSHGQVRPVEATVKVDGERLTLALPLLASARFEDWTVSSSDVLSSRSEDARYGDYVPDQVIEGAYFTRGTGTPNDAGTFGDEPCGPPEPPLLAQ